MSIAILIAVIGGKGLLWDAWAKFRENRSEAARGKKEETRDEVQYLHDRIIELTKRVDDRSNDYHEAMQTAADARAENVLLRSQLTQLEEHVARLETKIAILEKEGV